MTEVERADFRPFPIQLHQPEAYATKLLPEHDDEKRGRGRASRFPYEFGVQLSVHTQDNVNITCPKVSLLVPVDGGRLIRVVPISIPE